MISFHLPRSGKTRGYFDIHGITGRSAALLQHGSVGGARAAIGLVKIDRLVMKLAPARVAACISGVPLTIASTVDSAFSADCRMALTISAGRSPSSQSTITASSFLWAAASSAAAGSVQTSVSISKWTHSEFRTILDNYSTVTKVIDPKRETRWPEERGVLPLLAAAVICSARRSVKPSSCSISLTQPWSQLRWPWCCCQRHSCRPHDQRMPPGPHSDFRWFAPTS